MAEAIIEGQAELAEKEGVSSENAPVADAELGEAMMAQTEDPTVLAETALPSDTEVKEIVKEAVAEGEQERDDLTKLTGIGKVGQDNLYSAGITTFAQIAAMSEEEAAASKIKAEAVAEAKELVGA